MIKIDIQEAEAFDRLSICECKLKTTTNPQIQANLHKQANQLQQLISETVDNPEDIYLSIEYADLYNSNSRIFSLLDEVNKGIKIDASVINSENYNRFLCKQKLQNKFFDGDLDEIKIGYKE